MKSSVLDLELRLRNWDVFEFSRKLWIVIDKEVLHHDD